MKKNECKYLISCVIPCYNVEIYLEDAVNSIINQTIGFNNIELIIVNDGSNDSTPQIGEKYQSKYSNVKYISQKNGGISSARNSGLDVATGKYISFLDSDDTWDKDAFEKGIKMLEKHKEIDFVSFRVKQFEAVDQYHVLDYKYDKDKIVDIKKDITMVQTLSTDVIYRTDVVKKHKFDSKIKYSEDAKYICDLLFENNKYGIIASSNYNQRKRENNSSTIQGCLSKIDWYTVTIRDVYSYIINKSIKKYGKILDFFQLLTLYDFQWRFFTKRENIMLNEPETKKYYKNLVNIIKKFDDKNILLTPGANEYKKRKILEIKHGGNVYKNFIIKNNSIYFKNTKIIDKKDLTLRLENISVSLFNIRMKFKFNMFVTDELYLYINGEKIKCEKVSDKSNLVYDEKEFYVDICKYECNFKFKKEIEAYTYIDGKKCYYDIKFSSEINNNLNKKGYYKLKYGKLSYMDNKIIIKRSL